MSSDPRSPNVTPVSDPGRAEQSLVTPQPHKSLQTPETTGGDGGGRTTDFRSVPDLLRELSDEGADLVRQEVALAKAEMNEKADLFTGELTSMAIGGAFMLAALFFVLWAANTGLTALLTPFVGLEIAVWLSPLILAVLLAGIGWIMIKAAQRSMSKEGLKPRRTMDTLQRDGKWAGREAQKLKEALRNG